MVGPLPYPDMPEEVMLVSPSESPESSLEKDAKLFIEEEHYNMTPPFATQICVAKSSYIRWQGLYQCI